MTAMSDYLEDALLDHALGTSSMTMPSATYVQLHTGAPGENGTSNVSAETTRNDVNWDAASGGTAALAAASTWSDWDAGSETISHISIWDAATDGNCLFVGPLSASRAVVDTDDFTLTTATTVTFA